MVVLDYNLNNKFEILKNIKKKEKCEILVNACCIPNCARRGEHYQCIAKQQNIALQNRKIKSDKKIPSPGWYCEYGDKNSFYTIQEYETFISADDIWEKYVPMGYTHFKIEGRTANLFNLIDTYCHYLIKPEFKDHARFLLLTNLEQSKMIIVNKPRKGMWP